MVRLELDDEQAQWLINSVENYLNHLRVEIVHTDKKDFRQALKARETFLMTVLGQLRTKA